MGRVILCETTPATISYIFPNTKIEVFSYEELCYYLFNNIALVNEEYISAPMFQWIEEELKLSDLAGMLRGQKRKGAALADLLMTILTYKEYYTVAEVKEFIVRMEKLNGLTAPHFRKLQADGYLRYHKYLKAITIYDEILVRYPELKNNKPLLASIYHNKAVALANNFEQEKAMAAYQKAYELNKDPKSIYAYLLLMAITKGQIEVKVMAKYYGVEDMVEKVLDAVQDAETDMKGSSIYHRLQKALFHYEKQNMTDYDKRMNAVLEQLKSEFREQTV